MKTAIELEMHVSKRGIKYKEGVFFQLFTLMEKPVKLYKMEVILWGGDKTLGGMLIVEVNSL